MDENTFTPQQEAEMITGKIGDALAEEFDYEDANENAAPNVLEIRIMSPEWRHQEFRITVEPL